MELVGKVVAFTPLETGTSEKGSWARRQIVVKTLDQNPVHVAFTAMGLRLTEAEKFKEGDVVRIRFGVESRLSNNKWFSDIKLWQISEV